MTLVEFVEKISLVPISEWQKQFLSDYEQAKKENKLLMFVSTRISGMRMLMQIIQEYEKEKDSMLLPPKQECTQSKRCTLAIDGNLFTATVEEHQIAECEFDKNLKHTKVENIYRIYHLDEPFPYLKSGMVVVMQDSTQVRKCYMSDNRMRLIEY